jgi:hypothetical protein
MHFEDPRLELLNENKVMSYTIEDEDDELA